MARFNLLERRISRFLQEPVSVRRAAGVIVFATAIIVVGGGSLMRVVDHREYPTIWRGMWWAIQTVTTVGYGDVTPREIPGRIVAVALMLEGIALLAIVTAAITSTFVERAQAERAAGESAEEQEAYQHLDARFDDLATRLERVEALLQRLGGVPD